MDRLPEVEHGIVPLGKVTGKSSRLRRCIKYFATCRSERWTQTKLPTEMQFSPLDSNSGLLLSHIIFEDVLEGKVFLTTYFITASICSTGAGFCMADSLILVKHRLQNMLLTRFIMTSLPQKQQEETVWIDLYDDKGPSWEAHKLWLLKHGHQKGATAFTTGSPQRESELGFGE